MSDRRVIVAGWFTVDPAKRAHVIASHKSLIARARQAPGCIDLAISADTLDPSRVNNFELWESSEHLEAWRKVANAPKPVTDIAVGDMQKHEVATSGEPF